MGPALARGPEPIAHGRVDPVTDFDPILVLLAACGYIRAALRSDAAVKRALRIALGDPRSSASCAAVTLRARFAP